MKSDVTDRSAVLSCKRAIAAPDSALNSKGIRLSNVLLFRVSLAAAPLARAHAQRGTIAGTVSDTMGVVLESVQVLLMDTRSRRRTSGVASAHFLKRVEIAKLNPTSLSHVVERMKGRSGGCTDPNVYMDGVPAFASEGAASSG